MAPFTPATGPRLLAKTQSARERMAAALIEYARAERVSSAHLLFVTDADRAALGSRDFLWRKDCQFHWHNRDYASFDAFMATFRSEKRKKALRERRRVQENGVHVPHARAAKRWTQRCGTSCSGFPPARSPCAATSTTSTPSSSARCRRRCRARWS